MNSFLRRPVFPPAFATSITLDNTIVTPTRHTTSQFQFTQAHHLAVILHQILQRRSLCTICLLIIPLSRLCSFPSCHWLFQFFTTYVGSSTVPTYFLPTTTMSSADRNFGLRPRSGRGAGRGNPRQQTHANPWTRVPDNTAPGTQPVASLPAQHGNIANKFTTFCTIALGYPKNKPPPPKAALLRLFFGIIRTGDSSIAILPYDSASQENAICAPAHVPTTPAALGIYCSEFTHYLKRYRTKCRITSKVPLWMIKSKIFSELRANDFWINPTSIKCKDTEKCGYFLYAHPFMTQ